MKKNLTVFAIILLVNIATILTRNLSNLDELWNYNFARNMCDGLLPYKDFNMIITPLYPFIVSIFLKFIANELIVTRIIAALMVSVTMFIGYKILDNLIKNKWIPILATLGLLLIYKDEFWGDYNFALLLITLLVMFLELRNNKNNILKLNAKYDFFVGVLVGLAIITKQTTGIFLAFTFVIYKWILIKNKQDFILALKISFVRGLGILVPVIGFVIFLLFTNSMNDFIDYAIKGISTFENSFSYRELLTHSGVNFTAKVVSIVFLILLVIDLIVFVKNENKHLLVLLVFSIQNMIVLYPLSDKVHMYIAALPVLIMSVYVLSMLIEKYIGKKFNYILMCATVILSAYMVGNSVLSLVGYSKNTEYDLNHFHGIPIHEGIYWQVGQLTNYILEQEEKGKKAYILDKDAALYMIVLDKYNKNYDLLLKGNLGSKGEAGIIEDIKNEKNAVFIIEMTKSTNRQSTEEIRTFVHENFEQVDTILNMGVFEERK